MVYRKLQFYLLCCFLLLAVIVPGACFAEKATVTESQWHNLTSDDAFYYRNQKEAIEKIKPPASSNAFDKVFAAIFRFFSSRTGRIIVWSGFFLLLAWALFRIFIGGSTGLFRKKTRKKDDDETVIEENVLEGNWEKQLHEAIDRQDPRLAVRYSYMWLLQLMQQNNLIAYRQDKTNYDYYAELANPQYKQPFKQLMRQYEYAWYGDYPMSTSAYEAYMNTFNMLKNRLTHQ